KQLIVVTDSCSEPSPINAQDHVTSITLMWLGDRTRSARAMRLRQRRGVSVKHWFAWSLPIVSQRPRRLPESLPSGVSQTALPTLKTAEPLMRCSKTHWSFARTCYVPDL